MPLGSSLFKRAHNHNSGLKITRLTMTIPHIDLQRQLQSNLGGDYKDQNASIKTPHGEPPGSQEVKTNVGGRNKFISDGITDIASRKPKYP